MRWIWIDRFTEFVSGDRAVAVKNVSRAEDYLEQHLPGYPIMPPSLMIEGMAQTAGILVGEARQFTEKVILAKIRRTAVAWLRSKSKASRVRSLPGSIGVTITRFTPSTR